MEKKITQLLLERQKKCLRFEIRIFKRYRGLQLHFLVIKMIITGLYSPLLFQEENKGEKKMCSKHCVTLNTKFCHCQQLLGQDSTCYFKQTPDKSGGAILVVKWKVWHKAHILEIGEVWKQKTKSCGKMQNLVSPLGCRIPLTRHFPPGLLSWDRSRERTINSLTYIMYLSAYFVSR